MPRIEEVVLIMETSTVLVDWGMFKAGGEDILTCSTETLSSQRIGSQAGSWTLWIEVSFQLTNRVDIYISKSLSSQFRNLIGIAFAMLQVGKCDDLILAGNEKAWS